jgi:hypothetical protein
MPTKAGASKPINPATIRKRPPNVAVFLTIVLPMIQSHDAFALWVSNQRNMQAYIKSAQYFVGIEPIA